MSKQLSNATSSTTPTTNIITPDYSGFIKQSSNVAIVEKSLELLLSDKFKPNIKTAVGFFIKIFVIIIIKHILENLKEIVGGWNFFDTSLVKYWIQTFKRKECSCLLAKNDDNWVYVSPTGNNVPISIASVNIFLQKKKITTGSTRKQYYREADYLVKILQDDKSITFCYPDEARCKDTMAEHVRTFYEIKIGDGSGKGTVMHTIGFKQNAITIEHASIIKTIKTVSYGRIDNFLSTHITGLFAGTSGTSLVINCNGPPGVGKSCYADYVATCGIFTRIFKFDMSALDASYCRNFDYIFTQVERDIKQKLIEDKTNLNKDGNKESINIYLFMIDELDKWYDGYIGKKKDSLLETSRNIQITNNEKKEVEHSQKPMSSEELELKLNNIKKEFYSQFLAFLNGSKFKDYNFIYIFNTNNYDRVFGEITIDNEYYATVNRITKCNFEPANKTDIVFYLQNFLDNISKIDTSKMNPNVYNFISKNLNEIKSNHVNADYTTIRNDIKISYRTLYQIITCSEGKIGNIIDFINNGQDVFNINGSDLVNNILHKADIVEYYIKIYDNLQKGTYTHNSAVKNILSGIIADITQKGIIDDLRNKLDDDITIDSNTFDSIVSKCGINVSAAIDEINNYAS
jgi:hypothetical protein